MRVELRLLGGFTVQKDGVIVPASRWHSRPAAALVKLLALSPQGRLHNDRVIDALWPDLTREAASPRLHKAAHFARQTLGSRDAVVLRGEVVSLFPGADLEVDAVAFDAAADVALRSEDHSAEACAKAIDLYGGELLPEDLGDAWLDEPRSRLQTRFGQLLAGACRWEDLLLVDPANEEAHVELLRAAVVAGDRTRALRRFDEMERVLEQELGISPSPEAFALRERALAVPARPAPPPRNEQPSGRTPGRGAHRRGREPLLERDAELESLRLLVESVMAEGRGAVVLVTGESGSGKSSLVRSFTEGLGPEIMVASGGCDDLLAPRSLGPFRDMAMSWPELAAALAEGSPEDVLPALFRVLAVQPTVVVLEDVHWADDVTVDAIRFLARRIPGIPAVLVLTYRDADVGPGHPVRQTLGSLAGYRARRVELAPLSLEAVRRLAGPTDVDPDELHRVTKGNPFYVTEVLATGGLVVPATVRDAVLARVGRLPPEVRALVERLSVVPSRAERWLAESLVEDGARAVIQAERAGVVTGGSRDVSFRHELARRAIEASLTEGERVQANAAVLDALLARPEVEPSRIVHHAERAARTDVLLAQGPRAAEEAARAGAHRQAAEVLRVVLEHADALAPRAVAALLTQRAYSLYVVNQFEAAEACAESAVAEAERSQDSAVLADALTVLARVALFAQGPTRARSAAERAVAVIARSGDEARHAAAAIELARSYSNLPTIGIVADPTPRAAEYAERALALAGRLRREDLVGQALCYRGSSRLAAGDARGADDLDRAIEMAAADTRNETRVRCYVNAAGCAYRAGRFDAAERYVAAGLRVAADGEFSAGQYRLRLTAASVRASRGQWDHAVADLRELVAAPDEPGVMALLARSLLVRILARRGDPDAGDVLAAGWAVPIAEGDSYVAGPLAVAEVELAWLSGATDVMPPRVAATYELAVRSGHKAMQGELAAYLRRAGIEVTPPDVPAGPWAAALAGHWEAAASAWARLGERYEQAVELAWSGDTGRARDKGLSLLRGLGAGATLALVPA